MKSIPLLLLAAATGISAQSILFSDSFERPDNRNPDASLEGISDGTGSSLAADSVYRQPYVDPGNESGGPDADATNGGGSRIIVGELELAQGAGTSNLLLNHNFNDATIPAAGGFSVSVDVTAVSESTAGQGGGFGIGMSAAEAAATGDAISGSKKMQDGFTGEFNNTGYSSVASFYLVLRADGTLVWGRHGEGAVESDDSQLLGSSDVGSNTGTISAKFSGFADFENGTEVDYEVFFNGVSQGSGAFRWVSEGENFIGLDARDANGVTFDNFEIATLERQGAVLTSDVSSVQPENPAREINLTWSGSLLPAGTSYTLSADNAVTFPNDDATGSAETASGSVEAVVDGTLGDTTFTLEFSNGETILATDTTTIRSARPNVIVMMTDDMGWSDFSSYGSEIQTPTIDRLGNEGLRYRNFYNTARCSTTRCALLSGLYTQQVAADPGASLPNLITENNVTFAELLAENGYRRYMTGKWHVGTSAERSPIGRGFQHIFGQTSGGDFPHNQVSGGNQDSFWNPANFGFYSEDDEIAQLDFSGQQFHQTDAIGDYANRFLDHHLAQGDDAPFLLYMPFNAVHWDINAPAEMADRYTDVGDDNPDDEDYYLYENGWDQTRADRFARQESMGIRDENWVLAPKSPSINSNGTASPLPPLVETPDWDTLDADRQADLARRMALYAAMLEQVDNNMKQVTDHLTTTGQIDNTIIFILADNGGNYEGGLFGKTQGTVNAAPVTGFENLRNLGQPGNPDLHIGGGWANVANTPFRLYKHYQHEGGIRTPFIVHWPDGVREPGRWINDRGHLIDVMATIADVTGTPYPEELLGRELLPLEGESLVPHFDPATTASFPERTLGFEHESNRAWFDGKYKFVTKNFAYLDGSSPADELELYDMSVDPTELNNLATEEPEILAQMVADWNAWAQRVGVVPNRLILPELPQVDPPALPSDLFIDTFNRPDNNDHDASSAGMSGPLAPANSGDPVYYDAFEAGGETRVSGNHLQMAFGPGMTETALRHNFIDSEILAAGGFSAQIRIDEIDSITDDIRNRYVGIAVGLSESEAQQSNDINSGPPYSFRSSDTTAGGTADFVVDLDLDGNVKCWSNGELLNTTPTGQFRGNLLVRYSLDSFEANSEVTAAAFLDGRQIDLDNDSASLTRTFQWDATESNHIGLTARASGSVTLNNLAVRTLPLSSTLASNFALAAGLSGSEAAPDADPDGDGDDNFTEWLTNGNPASAGSNGRLLSLAPAIDGGFRFNHLRLANAAEADLTYTFRYSSDLTGDPESWQTFAPEEISSQTVGDNYQAVLSAVPADLVTGNNRLFILIQAE